MVHVILVVTFQPGKGDNPKYDDDDDDDDDDHHHHHLGGGFRHL